MSTAPSRPWSRPRTFDRVVFDGGEFGHQTEAGSAEEHDYLGLPGLLEPEQVAVLLKQHQAQQVRRRSTPKGRLARGLAGGLAAGSAAGHGGADGPQATYRSVAELRKELNGLVAAWHHRTGRPHGTVHADLRSECGGPPVPLADAADLQRRIDTLRTWAVQRR